jgi:transcriptional regulator with XRE-family HTH domain
MAIGDHIRDLRWDAHLKQVELARRAGIAQNTLSQIELGNTVPSVPTLEKLARALGVPADELLKEPVPLAGASETGRQLERSSEFKEVVTAPEVLLEGLHNLGIQAGLTEAEALGRWLRSQAAWHHDGGYDEVLDEYDEVLIFPTRLTPELARAVCEILEQEAHQLENLHIVIGGGYIKAGLRVGE